MFSCLRFFSIQTKSLRNELDISQFIPSRVKNFCIIAHVDHGKSTLADRLLEFVGSIQPSGLNQQVLDKLPVERERGITVKAQTASMFHSKNSIKYLLNLIDTPGHVDFSFEVGRSLSCCETAILLVDATQGIQAQTFANFWAAFSRNLHIIPVLNKIDLPHANCTAVKNQLQTQFEIEPDSVLEISAKNGLGIDALVSAIIDQSPSPSCAVEDSLNFFIFDSWYDIHRGVVCMIRLCSGKLLVGQQIKSALTGLQYTPSEVGIVTPELQRTKALHAGQVGYMITGVKNVKEFAIGDTFFDPEFPSAPILHISPCKPQVFAGFFPMAASEYSHLKDSIEKLALNDSSVVIEDERHESLGSGFRIGFLGALHMDVFRQRIEQEFNADVLVTSPIVPYRVIFRNGATREIQTPSDFPTGSELGLVQSFEEKLLLGTFIFPHQFLGSILNLCLERRGQQTDYFHQLNDGRIITKFVIPLGEILTDFYSSLQRITSGYCTVDYEEAGQGQVELCLLTVTINRIIVDEFNMIIPKMNAENYAKKLVRRIKELMTKQMFEIDIRALLNGKIVSSERLNAYRKDVTAKCYGGDATRKAKLLSVQNEGKRRMKMIGKVEIPRSLFIEVIKSNFSGSI